MLEYSGSKVDMVLSLWNLQSDERDTRQTDSYTDNYLMTVVLIVKKENKRVLLQ